MKKEEGLKILEELHDKLSLAECLIQDLWQKTEGDPFLRESLSGLSFFRMNRMLIFLSVLKSEGIMVRDDFSECFERRIYQTKIEIKEEKTELPSVIYLH